MPGNSTTNKNNSPGMPSPGAQTESVVMTQSTSTTPMRASNNGDQSWIRNLLAMTPDQLEDLPQTTWAAVAPTLAIMRMRQYVEMQKAFRGSDEEKDYNAFMAKRTVVAQQIDDREKHAKNSFKKKVRELRDQTHEGNRNTLLFEAALLAGKLVHEGWLEPDDAIGLVEEAARACGLDQDEITTSGNSGYQAGLSTGWLE